jgi:c-di-GMP-binding flagellar brake protein YcgR
MRTSQTDEEVEDRYFLRDRMEISSVLNNLIHHIEPITVRFNGGRDFIATTLLEVAQNRLIFDPGGDAQANLRLQRHADCVFSAEPEGIRVQFSSGPVRPCTWGGGDAFWVPLPEHIVRLQRRESYRNQLPIIKPPMANLISSEKLILGTWPAHDLSIGGIGVTILQEPRVELDQYISCLRITLPSKHDVDTGCVVRHITYIPRRQSDSSRYRIGLAFRDLPLPMEIAIQRYLIKLEYERRKLLEK